MRDQPAAGPSFLYIKKGRLENRPAGHALKAIALTLFNCFKNIVQNNILIIF